MLRKFPLVCDSVQLRPRTTASVLDASNFEYWAGSSSDEGEICRPLFVPRRDHKSPGPRIDPSLGLGVSLTTPHRQWSATHRVGQATGQEGSRTRGAKPAAVTKSVASKQPRVHSPSRVAAMVTSQDFRTTETQFFLGVELATPHLPLPD
jgi:hypothetical protein